MKFSLNSLANTCYPIWDSSTLLIPPKDPNLMVQLPYEWFSFLFWAFVIFPTESALGNSLFCHFLLLLGFRLMTFSNRFWFLAIWTAFYPLSQYPTSLIPMSRSDLRTLVEVILKQCGREKTFWRFLYCWLAIVMMMMVVVMRFRKLKRRTWIIWIGSTCRSGDMTEDRIWCRRSVWPRKGRGANGIGAMEVDFVWGRRVSTTVWILMIAVLIGRILMRAAAIWRGSLDWKRSLWEDELFLWMTTVLVGWGSGKSRMMSGLIFSICKSDRGHWPLRLRLEDDHVAGELERKGLPTWNRDWIESNWSRDWVENDEMNETWWRKRK